MTKTGRPAAVGTVKYEDDNLRVTEWRFAAGAATGWHRHAYDYVVVPLSDGKLGLEDAAGAQTEASLVRGVPYHRQAGVEHDVVNINAGEYAFLEVELKR